MAKAVIDVSMSLDGFVAGPDDGPKLPVGGRGGADIQLVFQCTMAYEGSMFKPKGANREVVAEMFEHAGVMLTGRRTYEIAKGWNGEHPVNAIPVVIMTHKPPVKPPKGKWQLVFVADGIESAVKKAKSLANDKHVGIAGASIAQQALRAGLVDELYLHIAPILLGAGVRLFEHLGDAPIQLKRIRSVETEEAMHVRYEVVRS
jgi:dihydrofolate reductase